ncbi:L,D-transpeptidase family protein [Actinomyces ruminicola]|uniref:Putative peptidoglycan binding domain-containing protein n=1 Tax=Actinomyces ruminicola TaxID=332524 RepID=A0A1G9XM06_9ACTO|nr:L,D-transpeptidase family protein [Actinomyces ruminicola]SDM97869.1 Putative peptidoglycan binding domain-containing protein [Actinomyces ruminicola]
MHSDKLPTGQSPEEMDESSTSADVPADTDVASDTVLKSPYGETTAIARTSILTAARSAPTAGTPDAAAAPGAQTAELDPVPGSAASAPDESSSDGDRPIAEVAGADAVGTTVSTADTPAEPQDASLADYPDPAAETASAPAPAASVASSPSTASPDVAASAQRPRRRGRWALSAVAAVAVLLGVGGYAYAEHYADVAVPGTTVAGTDVSGMSREEIVDVIEAREQAATVTVTGDAEATVTLTELGTTVDAEATADAAMRRGAGVVDRFKALLNRADIGVVTTTDDTVLEAYADGLVPDDQSKAQNASITLNAEATAFEVTASSEGLSIDTTDLANAAAEAATSLTSTSVDVSYENTLPAVSDDDAQAVADTANEWIAQDVVLATADGTESYTADAATKASWISVTENLDAAPTLSIDSDKVAQWVDAQATEANVTPVIGQRNVNSAGEVVATSVEAVAGQTVNNAEAITKAIAESLSSGEAYSGSFEMTTSEEQWEEREIADGAENLVYQAAEGEKWVDINLSSKTVTAYEGATVVRGPVYVVDGAPATPTVTGTFHVYLKYETQTMRGQNADGTDYETENVPWISYFYQGYALHGAPWRSSWGFSGSHGCLNMPVGEAKWFYDWSEIGTTVVSHY